MTPETSPLLRKGGETKGEKMVIDDMLTRYCGEFGMWQLRHFSLANLAWALDAFHTMIMVFADREPEWRCVGSGCSDDPASFCGLESGAWEWIGGSAASTVSEWGLICGDKYKIGLVQSTFFAGAFFGAGIFGHLSDSHFGRRGSLMAACIGNAIFGCLTAFAPNYWVYMVLRFLNGVNCGGVGLCAFVLGSEPIGPSMRGVVGMSTFYFFSSGIAVLSGVAYIFRHSWRELYIATSVASLVYLITVMPFISESPRWYLVRGKIDQAMNVMRKIAQGNGKHLPSSVNLALDDDCDDKSSNKVKNHEEELSTDREPVKGSIIDVIRSPLTRVRLVGTIAINFLCCIVYYGISLNVVNLKTNIYISVLVNAVAEMPAFALTSVLLDRFGRKPLAIGTVWFSGVFCLVGSMVKNTGKWQVVRMLCGVLGIFGMAGNYNLLFIYTAELFPTVVRNAALGCSGQAAQLGAIVAPFVVVLGGGFPLLIFGICGILGGIFTMYLPETLNRPLYDTMTGMADAEAALITHV